MKAISNIKAATQRILNMRSSSFSKVFTWLIPLVMMTTTAPLFAGIKLSLGNLPPGKAIRITYQTTINNPLPAGVGSITNQNTISGKNFTSVVTDDPTTGTASDPTVALVSVPPFALNFSKTNIEDTTAIFSYADFGANFSDGNGDSMTNIIVMTLPSNGTLKLSGVAVTVNQQIPTNMLGNLTFVPTADYYGLTTFTWKATDSSGMVSDNAGIVHLYVLEENDDPIGGNDVLNNIAEDSGQTLIPFATLTANDFAGPANENNQALTIIGVSNAIGGTVSIVGTNVAFTPPTNYFGPAGFTYTLQDNGTTAGTNQFKTSIATVSFTVTEVNDPPVAANDSLPSVGLNPSPITIPFSTLQTNDTVGPANESGQSIKVSAVLNPKGGKAEIQGTDVVFTIDNNFKGVASFDYVVQDNGTTSGTNDFKTGTATAFVVVGDYLSLTLGRTNIESGEIANVPITLSSSAAVKDLRFSVGLPAGRFTNATLTPIAPEIGTNTISYQTTNALIQLQAASGQSFSGTRVLATLNLASTTNQQSGIAWLPISSLTVTNPTSSFSDYVISTGRVVIVNVEPVLIASGQAGQRSLEGYANVGVSYELQNTQTKASPQTWNPVVSYTQTNRLQVFDLSDTNSYSLYRLFRTSP